MLSDGVGASDAYDDHDDDDEGYLEAVQQSKGKGKGSYGRGGSSSSTTPYGVVNRRRPSAIVGGTSHQSESFGKSKGKGKDGDNERKKDRRW